jgi:hypothetical protein
MLVRVLGSLVIVAAAMAAAAPAGAGGYRTKERAYVREAPVRDCTRINGRYGYYGNPWCSEREQARFDRWSASRRWWR